MVKTHFGSFLLAIGMSAGLLSWSCSSSSRDASGSGGASASGGSTGGSTSPGTGGTGPTCSNVTACGGDLTGTWTVKSSCLKVTGNLDLSLFGAGCPLAPVTGDLTVTGTWTANANGTYSDDTVTSGTEQITLAPSCLVISSTQVTCAGAGSLLTSLGYMSLTCTNAAGGGCNCTGTVHQTGGMGLVVPSPSTMGNFTPAGHTVTVTGDSGDAHYDYCTSSNTLTVTPQSANPTITGAIVLQGGSASGSGGVIGSGGRIGSGGATAAGGSTVAGSAGSGGHAGAGGRAGSSGGSAGSAGSGTPGTGGAGGASAQTGPCDIYGKAGNVCVAAHSTVRALYGAYGGKLYQVRNAAGATLDIKALAPGGAADGAAQDAFCNGTTCVITVVYDQSGKGNDLWYQGSTMVPGSPSSSPSKATSESLMLGGHKVYSLYINPGNSYWVDASKSGIPLGSQPEGMYMVTSGKHYNGGCCFDYGNSETDRKADGSGAMDAINFSSITAWGTGAGAGPWVMADLEYGVFAQNNTSKNQNDPTQTSTYVTAVLKNNGTTEFALRGGNAASGALGTYYKGGLPGGWSPMKKQGAIVLGSGGDCCKPDGGANLSDGTFYEGCIVTGYPSDATEDAVQANVVAAGYGR
ncbi:MAG TPA: arabinofuranosidase catalytic domain-containing protein [Polyangia bacterium]|nr:arabinofuranosidase catalytic domain-containing protein [Polyangia bacterium]